MLRFMGSQRVGHNWATDLICLDLLLLLQKSSSCPYSEYKTAGCQHCGFKNSSLCFSCNNFLLQFKSWGSLFFICLLVQGWTGWLHKSLRSQRPWMKTFFLEGSNYLDCFESLISNLPRTEITRSIGLTNRYKVLTICPVFCQGRKGQENSAEASVVFNKIRFMLLKT